MTERNRRRAWVAVASGWVTLACGGLVPPTEPAPVDVVAAPAPPPPAPLGPSANILWIIADDLGTDKIGAYGEHPDAPATPRLDALAADGALFVHAYAYGHGAPSRAAMLTGRYARRYGAGSVASDAAWSLPLDEVTVPEMLTLAPDAWSTAAIGAWHLGAAPGGPSEQGFGQFAGTFGDIADYRSLRWHQGGDARDVREYATSYTTDAAIAQMRAMSSPFFLQVAYHAPHAPDHEPPAALHSRALGPDATPADRVDAAIEALDREIGRLIDAIPADRRADTYVVFVADNGTARDAVRPPRDPDRAKGSLHEGGTNVPLIVSGPGVRPGSRVERLTHVVDLFPTVAEWARVDLAPLKRGGAPLTIDGTSFAAALGGASVGPAFVYTESFGPSGGPPYELDWRAVRDDRFKVIDLGQGRVSFFDLAHRDDDGDALRPAQLTPAETERYDALRAELTRMEQLVLFEY